MEGARPDRPREHKGWYAPRTLPHFDSPEVVQAIAFRLANPLPPDVVAARNGETLAAHRRRVSAALDLAHGGCLLRDPAFAETVETALLHGVGIRYALFAWGIMPNHVHVLIAPIAGNRLADVVQAWKSSTSKAINRRRGVSSSNWRREYFDRLIRDEQHLATALAYVENSPVNAGMAAKPEG